MLILFLLKLVSPIGERGSPFNQRNRAFASNSKFPIFKSLQPDDVYLPIFQIKINMQNIKISRLSIELDIHNT